MSRHILLISVLVLTACSERTTAPTVSSHRPISSMIVRPGVTVRSLKGLNGATDSVTAFNDSDVVVGMRRQGTTSRAFQWTAANGLQFLTTPTGWNTEAFSVNLSGAIVGDASNPPKQWPVQWHGASIQAMQVLSPGDSLLGQIPGCWGRGINTTGVMAGYCYDPFYATTNAVQWQPNGVVSALCDPNDCPWGGFAYAINDRGVIAGGPSFDWANLKAFAFFPTNTGDTLPKLTQPNNSGVGGDVAYALKSKGIVAGYAWAGTFTPACHGDPAVWLSVHQKPIDIGAQFCGQANGIDGNNVVIGTLLQSPGIQAFIWTQTTSTQALPGLGGTGESSQAIAINNKREVLGTITSNGVKHIVIWTF